MRRRRATRRPTAQPAVGGDGAARAQRDAAGNCWKILIDNTDELASLIVREHGKPLADAKGEIAYSAEFFRWNAEETVRIRGELGSRRRAPTG